MSAFPGWRDYKPVGSGAAPKRSKYRAEPHSVLPGLEVVTGEAPGALKFASKREALRYVALRRDPAVANLRLQPRFPLNVTTPDGVKCCIGEYIADFAYQRAKEDVVEDAKGMRTPVYRWKKRHVELEHGIRIQEV